MAGHKEQKLFYEKLFKSEEYDENEAESLLSSVNVSLSRNEKENCNRPVTEAEIENAIKLLKSNKSPGDDGIINEFYKLYWYMIKPEFTKVLQYIFTSFNMSSSQYRAIITLLYKKGEREDLANWRPISLLNTDYKIITKILAQRLKSVLPKLVHPDQKGFIPGRNIADANRLLQDVIDYSEQKQINGSIIFVDYQKAFDRVEWQWADRCLEKLNFGNNFRKWINNDF